MRQLGMTMGAGLVLGIAGVCSAGVGVGAPHAPHSTDEFTIMTSDDGQTYEIVVTDKGVEARVDGLRLADDRVIQKQGQVILLDDDGKEMRVIALAPSNAPLGLARVESEPEMRFGYTVDVEVERPPVMLGVLLEPAGDALHAHLDLPPHAAVIEKVMEGLPASKAGLERWDIIIEAEGEPLDSEGVLHAALMDNKPGYEMDLVIVRNGREMDIEVELEAYDAEALGSTQITIATDAPPTPSTPGLNWQRFGGDMGQQGVEQAKRALEQIMESFEAQKGNRLELEGARREIERAMRQLERKQQSMMPKIRGAWRLDNQGRLFPQTEDEDVHEHEEDLHEAFEHRFEALEEEFEARMEEFEDRWEDLEDMFDRMFDRLERTIEDALDRRGRDDE